MPCTTLRWVPTKGSTLAWVSHNLLTVSIPVFINFIHVMRDMNARLSEFYHDWLSISAGAPANVLRCGQVGPVYQCAIMRMDMDGSALEAFATGVRNTVGEQATIHSTLSTSPSILAYHMLNQVHASFLSAPDPLDAVAVFLSGFDFHPVTGALYFGVLERDYLGDNRPDDTLTALSLEDPSTDFGFPSCHWVGDGPPELRAPGFGAAMADPNFPPAVPVGRQAPEAEPAAKLSTAADNGSANATLDSPCGSKTLASSSHDTLRIFELGPQAHFFLSVCCYAAQTPPPIQALGPHVSPLGVKFAINSSFPPPYTGPSTVFLAEHGSWNRQFYIGYRVAMVQLDAAGKAAGHSVFAEGWLRDANTTEQSYWGRPSGLAFLPDGSLLVSDDYAGVIYRITYGSAAAAASPRGE